MNENKIRVIENAKSQESLFWKRVADDLSKSHRSMRVVNLARIQRVTKEGDTIVVPGKVLGTGFIDHKVTVAAHSFSDSAIKKLQAAKCTVVSLPDMIKKHPKGAGRIIG